MSSMRNRLKLALLFAALPFLIAAGFPSYTGYVNDYAGVLGEQEKQALTALAETVAAKSGIQMAIVTVKDIGDTTIEDYANLLFETWKIGQKGKDNGLLFITSVGNRKVRIEVGYGLEEVLNDGKVGEILDQSVVPFYKSGALNQGIVNGAYTLAATLSTHYGFSLDQVIQPYPKKAKKNLSIDAIIKVIILMLIVGSLFGGGRGLLPLAILGGLSGGGRGNDFGGFGGSGFGGFGGGFSGGGGGSRGW